MTQQVFFDYVEPPPAAFRPPVEWRPVETLPELHGIVALDCETKDPGLQDRRGSSWAFSGQGFVTGIAFASDAMPDFYAGLRHSSGNYHDEVRFWTWLDAQARKPDVTFVMANAPYDIGWCQRHGIVFANTPYDVQGMATLLDENKRSYKLDVLMREYLGYGKNDEQMIMIARQGGVQYPMTNMDRLPTWLVATYAIGDARGTLDLFKKMVPDIEAQGLQRVLELERESVMCAVDMRRRGVRVDLEYVERLRFAYVRQRDELIQQVQAVTGVAISPWDAGSIARALRMENPDLQLERTSNGRESIRAVVLEQLRTPVATMVLEVRELDKAVSTFIDGYIIGHHHNGRIHADFNPTRRSDDNSESGVAGARFSSTNPNMQNIPVRTTVGRAIRKAFVGEKDEDWMKLDYSSQEPRITIHFANRARQRGAAEMVERYRADPHTDLHQIVADLMAIPRKKAKIINLGVIYGMQGKTFCNNLGLPTKTIHSHKLGRDIEVAGDEGQALLDGHAQAAPFVKGVFNLAKQRAEQRGFVTTLYGRRCRFERLAGEDRYWDTYKALNKIVQNSAAEQMKQALIDLRRAGIPYLVAVHDEAGMSRPRGEAGDRLERECRAIMENAVVLDVPSIAEAGTGPSWGAIDE